MTSAILAGGRGGGPPAPHRTSAPVHSVQGLPWPGRRPGRTIPEVHRDEPLFATRRSRML
jgi:hypothetical protein